MPRSTPQNIRRRGAVYWWRRIICFPHLGKIKLHPISLELSLFSKELSSARGRAAALTAFSERLKMSIQSDVANSGLDQAAIAQIYTSEMKSYRNVLMHMEADWKATPEYCGLSDHKTDMQMYERLWSGISDDGIGSPRGWAFVEKHFGDFDPEMQGRIQFLLRREINLPTDLAKDAERRLTDIGATPSAINIPLAMDVSR